MALKTVTGKLTKADGTPVQAQITAKLSASAIIASTQEVSPAPIYAQSATDGTWTMSLQANLDLTPATTYYTLSAGDDWVVTAVVPQTAGPFKIEDIMVAPPAVSPPAALDSAVVHKGRASETYVSTNDWTPTDYGYDAWNFDPVSWQAGQALTPAGTVFVVKLRLREAVTISTIAMFINAAGVTLTSGQCFAGLYDAALNLKSATADQAANWGSTGYKAMALSVAQAMPVGDCYVALFYNGTTGPSFGRGGGSNIVNGALAGAAVRCGTANTGQTTSMPATLTGLVAANNLYWAALT